MFKQRKRDPLGAAAKPERNGDVEKYVIVSSVSSKALVNIYTA